VADSASSSDMSRRPDRLVSLTRWLDASNAARAVSSTCGRQGLGDSDGLALGRPHGWQQDWPCARMQSQ
jgi:hypothetical protein